MCLHKPAWLFIMACALCPAAMAQQPYRPQPGDIIVSTNPNLEIQQKYRMIGAGPPTHAALVSYVLVNGQWKLVILESLIETGVIASDFSVLAADKDRTDIKVRTLHRPLTQEELTRLANWATSQLGKAYPPHMQVYMNALRVRPVRILHLPANTEPQSWFCSSMVAAGLIETGRVNGYHVRPSVVMPIDLINDRDLDLSPAWSRPRTIK